MTDVLTRIGLRPAGIGEYAISALLLVAIVVVLEADSRRRGSIAESVRSI
jgi:hypothetical protein